MPSMPRDSNFARPRFELVSTHRWAQQSQGGRTEEKEKKSRSLESRQLVSLATPNAPTFPQESAVRAMRSAPPERLTPSVGRRVFVRLLLKLVWTELSMMSVWRASLGFAFFAFPCSPFSRLLSAFPVSHIHFAFCVLSSYLS